MICVYTNVQSEKTYVEKHFKHSIRTLGTMLCVIIRLSGILFAYIRSELYVVQLRRARLAF